MWGDEERVDTVEGMKEEHRTKQEEEDERVREEGRRNGVGGEEEWRVGEGKQLKVAEDREQEREEKQAKSQGESAEVHLTEGKTGKEGELENTGAQESPREVLQTTTPSDRQDEAGEKSQGNTTDLCAPAAEDNAQTFLSPESTPLLEDRTQENTHDENTRAAKNTRTSSSSGGTNLCDLIVHTPLSSALPGEDRQTPHSERVN